jgi:hypothetical protein
MNLSNPFGVAGVDCQRDRPTAESCPHASNALTGTSRSPSSTNQQSLQCYIRMPANSDRHWCGRAAPVIGEVPSDPFSISLASTSASRALRGQSCRLGITTAHKSTGTACLLMDGIGNWLDEVWTVVDPVPPACAEESRKGQVNAVHGS